MMRLGTVVKGTIDDLRTLNFTTAGKDHKEADKIATAAVLSTKHYDSDCRACDRQ